MKQGNAMKNRHLINSAVRCALMTGAVMATAGYTSSVLAENANTPAQLQKVTVTGTRIKRTSIETAQPITRISHEQIERSGYTNVGQLLGQLSFTGSHTNGASSYTFENTVNLRNLGANRTLVLVNGKRWIEGLGGTTNLNTIPTSIIDHIEVLQDGASAVYGSDAISGVVNIITVKNYKGAEVHAFYGIHNDPDTGHWDGQTKQYDLTMGGGNGRGNVVFNLTYRETNPIYHRDRKLTRTPIAGEPAYVGGSSQTPRGRFQLFGPAAGGQNFGQGTCSAYDPGQPGQTLCDFTLQNAPEQPSLQNFRNFQQTDLYNSSQYFNLQTMTEDVTAYLQGHYDLFDNVTVTANAAFIRDYEKQHFPPIALAIGANNVNDVNDKTKIGVSASNPYNPFGVDLVANHNAPCLATGSCLGLNNLNRLVSEEGQTTFAPNRDFYHVFVGFNGYVNLLSREIDWDVGFMQNTVQSSTEVLGYFNTVHVATALGPASQCTSPCVPLNVFGGPGSITPAQLHYIKFENHDLTQSNLRDWTANLSSDLYDLPAGPLGVAIGYEHLDNYGFHHPSAIDQLGNSYGSVLVARNGRVVRDAEYAELNIPLLADLPGVKNLSVDVANRWAQFKRIGGQTGLPSRTGFSHNSSGRLNIRYQPISDLLLRASWSQGFRTPNISELFQGVHDTTFQISDPCAGGTYGGYHGGPLPPNCPNGALVVQPNSAVHGRFGSNVNLKPESSLSRTVGFIYSPSQVPGLDINADYFKIEITNAVGSIGAQSIVNGCFNNATFCNLITVQGNQITSISNLNTNVGSLLTEGIDVGLHYKFPSTPFGDFNARIGGTFLKTFDQTKVNLATKTGFATSHLAGVDPRPKRWFNGYLDWDYGNWSAQYHIEYLGEMISQCGVSITGYCTYPNRMTNYQGTPGQFSLGRQHMGATVYHDVHVAYTAPAINTTFALGVNNLFNKKPPITGGGGFDFGIYRIPSRFIYGSIRVRF
jgi:outer membrane receptor protein involved in Fe transport